MAFGSGAPWRRGRATLLSRRRHDWSAQFPAVVGAAERLAARSALLDGELAAIAPDGRTSLHAMHDGRRLPTSSSTSCIDGADLTGQPIRAAGRCCCASCSAPVRPRRPRYVEHVVGGGGAFFEEACRHRLEGIVSKAAGSAYRPGRAERDLAEDEVCPAPGVRDWRVTERSAVGSLGALGSATTTATAASASPGRRGPASARRRGRCWRRSPSWSARRRHSLRTPDGLPASRRRLDRAAHRLRGGVHGVDAPRPHPSRLLPGAARRQGGSRRRTRGRAPSAAASRPPSVSRSAAHRSRAAASLTCEASVSVSLRPPSSRRRITSACCSWVSSVSGISRQPRAGVGPRKRRRRKGRRLGG